jgi:transposase
MTTPPPKIIEKKSPKKRSSCPKCKDRNIIKSGFVGGDQRWKCKACSYQYTKTEKRGRPLWQKSLVVFLYSYGVSLHAIARIFDVQPSTVFKWVKHYAKDHVHTPEDNHVNIIGLGDMPGLISKNIINDPSMLCISISDSIFKDGTGIAITKRAGL